MSSAQTDKMILVVDDNAQDISMIMEALSLKYAVKETGDASTALAELTTQTPDLVLLRMGLKGSDSLEFCRRLKAEQARRHCPILLLSHSPLSEDDVKGLEAGADDVIHLPLSPVLLAKRIEAYLALKEAQEPSGAASGKATSIDFEQAIRTLHRTREIEELQSIAMVAISSLAETRHPETGNNIGRIQHYMRLLAEGLRAHGKFTDFLTAQNIDALVRSAPLYDIGKIGVPEKILCKRGPLTDEEFETMKRHTTIGYNALASAAEVLRTPNAFLDYAKEFALYHHERWDGSGYPTGLVGEDIPLPARMMAIADVYEAMVSKRLYKPSYAHEDVVEILEDGAGTLFDPTIIEVFLKIADKFRYVGGKYIEGLSIEVLSRPSRTGHPIDFPG